MGEGGLLGLIEMSGGARYLDDDCSRVLLSCAVSLRVHTFWHQLGVDSVPTADDQQLLLLLLLLSMAAARQKLYVRAH